MLDLTVLPSAFKKFKIYKIVLLKLPAAQYLLQKAKELSRFPKPDTVEPCVPAYLSLPVPPSVLPLSNSPRLMSKEVHQTDEQGSTAKTPFELDIVDEALF